MPADIAIVGMSAILPGATDVRTFWENTLRGVDAITEVPPDRWDWRLYYDENPKTPDKITSKWGGFLPDIPFDPLRYGMPPSSLASIEPLHLLTLEAVRAALDDAGYGERPFPRERTSVILGAGGGAAQLAMGYAFRSYLPLLDTVLPGAGQKALRECRDLLPSWTEDSFPGILLNVAAGRVANRFDLGGSNYTVDAACGSSLAAAALAVRELESGASDCVILGGSDTVQNPFTYLAFSKTHAFSPRGRCRPFDASADGIVISEGVAVLVLKRLADAERDGDRIYAVVKAVGASSDGRAKGLTAPRPDGQVRALRRAYSRAGISPASIGYVEAHGTGTAAGDLAELEALSDVFQEAGAREGSCALGSVKSSIGHTKCAAGLAGLINAALSLYHQVLPPTIGVTRPNPRADLATSPFHLSTAMRPWLHDDPQKPRRAGVSAFGFGGTNFHAVLEAYDRDPLPKPAPLREWPAELFVWRAPSPANLLDDLQHFHKLLNECDRPALRDLSRLLIETAPSDGPTVLAIVAESHEDLRAKIDRARRTISEGSTSIDDPFGTVYAERIEDHAGRVAFVFPGQGSQYPNMLGDLAIAFEDVRRTFEEYDQSLQAQGRSGVGSKIFPPPAFNDDDRERQREALQSAETAQPAVGAASVALLHLLNSLGLHADFVAGHSYGELVALYAAGSLSIKGLAELSAARGGLLHEAFGQKPGAMAALMAGPNQMDELLEKIPDVHAVNWNGPSQTVISGSADSVRRVVQRAESSGIHARILPVSGAFHSPKLTGVKEPLATLASRLGIAPPNTSVYSNATAARMETDPDRIADRIGEHASLPVRFAEMIETMYADGARLFVEAGPSATLTPLIHSILGDRPHRAIALDRQGRPGLLSLLHGLAKLVVSGVPIRLERLIEGRGARRLDPRTLQPLQRPKPLPPSAWIVNGARARPASAPEPRRFGVGQALPLNQHEDARDHPGRPLARFQGFPELPTRNGSRTSDASQNRLGGGSSHREDEAITAFQETMKAFLDVQRTTMLKYLESGRTSQPTTVPELVAVLPNQAQFQGEEPAGRSEHAAPGEEIDQPHSDPSFVSPRRIRESSIDTSLSVSLLRIVQERTGYPLEMLRLDLDMEADLGIDSIKRVEIVGSLRDQFPGLIPNDDARTMDALARARTLGDIVDLLRGPESAEPPRDSIQSEDEVSGEVRRLVLNVVEAPLPHNRAGLVQGGVVLVTDDGRGIARALAAEFRALGHDVIRVKHGVGEGDVEGVNLTSDSSVSALMERVRERGHLTAIVHALPLRDHPPGGLDSEDWTSRIHAEVKGLFLLAKSAADDLEHAAKRGGACLIAATAMGGASASVGDVPGNLFPGQGGIAGLIKTLAHEWPSVRTRVVDMDPRIESEVLAADLVHEVLCEDPLIEVGYQAGRRVALRAVASRGWNPGSSEIPISAGEPVIVTGGARGITAAISLELARLWQPKLLLIGTSPLPPSEENPTTAELTAPAELKAALFEQLRRVHQDIRPADVEKAYQALKREREIRTNLKRFREAGASVEYAAVDVRDTHALRTILDDWKERHGSPVGLIHGAGVIQDKLLRDKSTESFDRVLSPKIEGALNLARWFANDPPRFAVFFSSIAGRFGNQGQSDYAAANEVLNKLAIWLDRQWPASHVVSMIWGPWSGLGMVSELEPHLTKRGMTMISPEIGAQRLVEELRNGRKGEVEVIIAGRLDSLVRLRAETPQGGSTHESR